jgi:ApbE superfamily uncharacterized protein (UPF0280 family)
MIGPQVSLLNDCKRLHLHHGPIDLIIEAFGLKGEIETSYAQAASAFEEVLNDLAEELPKLRSADVMAYMNVSGPVASRMVCAVEPHSQIYVTPMAAVAGSVADYILSAMIKGRDLSRAYVNNGGDCALHLTDGQSFKMAAIAHGDFGKLDLQHKDLARGVATSGWRGRSHSLGIADAVTVVAKDAASADVAATLIANEVDLLGHPAITRQPANELSPDSDLGAQKVTTGVAQLSAKDTDMALLNGLKKASDMKRDGLILDALLFLNGQIKQTTEQRMLTDA